MTISYPLSLPTTNIKKLTLRASVAAAQTRSPFTMQTQVWQFTGEMWIAEVTLPIMDRATAEAWNCFLLKLNGPVQTFFLGDPSAATPRGSASGSPKVNGGSQVGKSLNTKGWTASQTNILREGDYIQIGNYLYKNLTDANSDGSGNATLDIWPRLRSSPADNTTIITSSAKGLFRLLQADYPIYTVTEDRNYELFFTAVEAVV
jgi:hypothetical protein